MTRLDLDILLRILIISFKKSKNLEDRLEIGKTFIALKTEYIDLFQDDISGGVPDSEVWRNCEGWETLYQVSNFGRVRCHEQFLIKTKKGGKESMAVYREMSIKAVHKTGRYINYAFWLGEKSKHKLVHRLVAQHFIPNPNNYSQVLHIDDDPGNPHFKNLRWGTQSHNIKDCVEKGRWVQKSVNQKLSDSDIPKIRKLISDGIGITVIGREFDVSHCTIACIRDGKTWKHIK